MLYSSVDRVHSSKLGKNQIGIEDQTPATLWNLYQANVEDHCFVDQNNPEHIQTALIQHYLFYLDHAHFPWNHSSYWLGNFETLKKYKLLPGLFEFVIISKHIYYVKNGEIAIYSCVDFPKECVLIGKGFHKTCSQPVRLIPII